MRLETIRKSNPTKVKRYFVKELSITQTVAILEFKSGSVYMETVSIDADGIETIELLHSTDKKHFTFIDRSRSGESHHAMKSYDRDYRFPLHSVVKV